MLKYGVVKLTIDKKNFQIEEIRIDEMLKKAFYNVSDFQRPYAWEKEQQSDLIKDIVNNLDIEKNGSKYSYSLRPYFLGNIILKDSNGQHVDIVDGQQRLITITMIMVVIRNMLNEIVENGRYSKEARKNSKKLITSIEKIIYRKLENSKKLPIISPLNSDEKYFFYSKILPLSNEVYKFREEGEYRNYTNGLYIIDDELRNYLSKYGTSALNKYLFFEAVYKQIINSTIITITLKEEETAYKIYSNLNSKGLHLSPVDLVKNDYLYKTRLLYSPHGTNENLHLWEKIYDNVKKNTSVSFDQFYKYSWFTIYPEDIEEYFDNGTNSFELFQEKFPSEKNAKDIMSFFTKLEKLSELVKDFNYPTIVSDWKRDKWPIYVSRLEFLVSLFKDSYSNEYMLWLLPLYYNFKEQNNQVFLKAMSERILFVSDVLLVYQLISIESLNEFQSMKNIQAFFKEIFKEAATFNVVEQETTFETLKNSFMDQIESKSRLVEILSSLSYSKYTNGYYKHHIIHILIRLNMKKGNHLLDYKGSIEHIIEDSEATNYSSNIGNLVYLEKSLNSEAGMLKNQGISSEKLLIEKFRKVYKKSTFPEVIKLNKDISARDFNEQYIDVRAKTMVSRFLDCAFS